MDPRDFRSFFRQFLGFPSHGQFRDDERRFERNEEDEPEFDDPRGHDMRGSRGHFSVFTDPLEIHRFFEQQMDEMLRNFGHGFGGFGGFGRERGQRSIILEPREEEEGPHSPRDFMLKDEGQPRVDTEIDSNQVDMGELETLLGRRENRSSQEDGGSNDIFGGLAKEGGGLFGGVQGGLFGGFGGLDGGIKGESSFTTRSFGSSVVERSVSKPGGGVETNRTVRNSDGSEIVTVTRRVGDQVYQQTTTKDKEGSTTTENRFTNLEEGDLEQFNKKFNGHVREEAGGWQVQPSPRQEMMAPPGDGLYNKLWDKFWGN